MRLGGNSQGDAIFRMRKSVTPRWNRRFDINRLPRDDFLVSGRHGGRSTDLKNPIEDLTLPAWNSTRIDSTSTWTGCWRAGESFIRLSRKFVSEILLCLSEIE